MTDTVQLTPKELKAKKIDSLLKYTRSQFYKNNYDLTIEVGQEVIKLAREENDYASIFKVSSLIGNAFIQIEDTIQAKKILTETVKEAEKILASRVTSTLISEEDKLKDYKSVITAKNDLGNYYAQQERFETAISIHKENVLLAEKIKDTGHLFILNFNLAELNISLGEKTRKDYYIKEAEHYVNSTNNYIREKTRDPYRAVAKLNVGKLHYIKKEPKLAIANLKESIELAQKSGYVDPIIEGYETYAKAEALQGNYKEAYLMALKADTAKIEKYKTDKIKAIETVTAKFKLNEYEQELKAQTIQNEFNKQVAKRETTILWMKIAGAILIVFSIFLYVSYRRRKKLVVDLIEKNRQYLEAKEKSDEYAKAKTILFSNITHELRTPMYGIIGISSILMEDKKLIAHEENLNSLKFSAYYLLSLINNVLHLTKIDATKKEDLNQVEFNVHNIIQNIVKSSKYINTKNPNTFTIEIDPYVPKTLIGDDVKLMQILTNLIGNAAKFTDNGNITVMVNRITDVEGKSCLHFSVKDTGIGISKERQVHIFNEFRQEDSNDKSIQGTGLGLPIVKKILDLYDSDLKIDSTVGKGTEVSFTLCYDQLIKKEINYKKLSEEDLKNERKLLLKGKNILAVDDNKINLIVTRKTLELYGANVKVSENGPDAIELVKEEVFDLILMDINMPVMDGFETTRLIRAFNEHIPILALTAVEKEKVTGDHAFNLMSDIIIKPYKNDVFVGTITKYINM
ncbi:histidine kinase [Ulvibacter litoralis]|nr:histidine kinase [Ulvibacter litoralis]